MSTRSLLLIILFLLPCSFLFAQSDTTENEELSYWSREGNTQLLFNQIAYSNWAKGGDNTISGTALFNYKAKYDDTLNVWETVIGLGYGLVNSEELGMRKNEDKIDLLSTYSYRAAKDFYYTGKINFLSQFTEGFNYPNDSVPVSDFLAPGYLITSAGMTWEAFEGFSLYLSPATGKITFVNNEALSDSGAYGVDRGETVRFEFGAYATVMYEKEIMENITLNTKLNLFNNFTDKNTANRSRIDVDWETAINLTVNEYITANIFAHLIYDHDIDVPLYETIDGTKTQVGTGKRLQIKETLGIGFSLKF